MRSDLDQRMGSHVGTLQASLDGDSLSETLVGIYGARSYARSELNPLRR